jgi:AcrR family transcriptional regulator
MPRSKELSQQMRAQSRSRILNEARRIFAEKGFFNCKMSEIAQAADMSQGNVYWYFDSKEHLLQSILSEGFEAHEEMVSQVAALPLPEKGRLLELIERSIDLYSQQNAFTTILLSLMAHGGTPFIEELGFDMSKIGMQYHRHLGKIFTEARTDRIVADLDLNTLIMFFYAFFNGLIITYGEQWAQIPRSVLRESILRLLGSETGSANQDTSS